MMIGKLLPCYNHTLSAFSMNLPMNLINTSGITRNVESLAPFFWLKGILLQKSLYFIDHIAEYLKSCSIAAKR